MNTSHPVLTVRPDSPTLQAILIFEDAPLIYFRKYGWGTLDNLDMNTSHPVLTVRPDNPSLQAILIFEDAPLIYFRNDGIGQRCAGSGTDLPPPRAQRSEIYSRRCCPPPPPHKAKATMKCRAPVLCLVTVRVSCLDTTAVPGGRSPPDPPHRARPLVLGQRFCLVLGHSSRAGGGHPPSPPPRARPLVLGHRFCLVLGHTSRAGGGGIPPDPHPRARPLVLGYRLIHLFFKRCTIYGVQRSSRKCVYPFWLPLRTSLILYKIIDPQLA